MKARLKGTAEWLEATALFFADGEHYGFRLGNDKEHYYYADALEFERETDWGAFRREVAKDIMSAFVARGVALVALRSYACEYAKDAIMLADALIKELQKR